MSDERHPDEHPVDVTVRHVSERLPPDVRSFALYRCRLVAVGDDIQAQTLPPDPEKWLIVLRESETREGVVAQEIAHAWFGHVRIPGLDEPAVERQARAQVRACGFSGPGADEPDPPTV